ncbi:pyridoxamine 5'-phosphate oxidase [Salsipaludibacter albus]|uniref:pyridoxamine 5'-phosphate oxidase n=1 Tax=Salsipaludibacter albus TaxID=2849650 RepID=UPI001EE45D4A|nr:pyridoxamine 5'-phosphate oxidase [Salsipaludibacter albus]MBY5163083.1 pyridoxamine 5'-phosphate oxidase [Salsipaludibacter albus]
MEDLPKLTPDDLGDDPLQAYVDWVDEARDAGVTDPDAVVVATATPDGAPSARAVLVRVVDADGMLFFTNRSSRKGRELAANDQVALTAVWTSLHRSVRVEGTAEWSTEAESDAYWDSRPHGSRLAAIASPQSTPIDRDALQARWEELSRAHPEGTPIPRPERWGGVRVRPTSIEFWQGRRFRLHDRLVYRRTTDGWDVVRLAP